MNISRKPVLLLIVSDYLIRKSAAFSPKRVRRYSAVPPPTRSIHNMPGSTRRFLANDIPPPFPPPGNEVITASIPADSTHSLVPSYQTGGVPVDDVRYSEFLKLVDSERIDKVMFSVDGTQLVATNKDGTRHRIGFLPYDPELLRQLTEHKVDVTVAPAQEDSRVGNLLAGLILLPVAVFAGLFFLSRQGASGGGRSGPLGFEKGSSQVKMIADTGVTFKDVAGCDGAKLELAEVVDFLKQPESYSANGCRIPRGVILDGPPGTGKTLLAKAVSGEAGVPFFTVSGSEFVEMYVGVGASRVRKVFDQAKQSTPCIIFIDEIDAVGRQRGAGFAGGNDEREQTVNQILVEMDGFKGNPGIITIAATNRVDILDRALLRPGRFDRRITVDLPDAGGRTQILRVHARGRPLEPDVDLGAVARRTPGFSGAQLENVMNEAAILAARGGKSTVGWEEIDGAVDRVTVGLEKRGGTAALAARHNELVAYHEAGHAVVGALIPDYDEVHKISIIPRSNGAGGLTFFSPQDSRLESGLYSRQYLESQLAVALGGRLAEEVVYGEDLVTAGASNDMMQVADTAKRMVKEWGMSDKVGRVALQEPGGGAGRPFLGRAMGTPRTQWGAKIMGTVDVEVERLVNNSYLKARKIIEENLPLLHHLAKTLVEQEVVTSKEFQMMLVQFGAQVVDFDVIGLDQNRDQLPFQHLPDSL